MFDKIIALFIAVCFFLMLGLIAVLYAQEPTDGRMPEVYKAPEDCRRGDIGCGHMKYHEILYLTLKRDKDKFSCCNLTDCRGTDISMIGDQMYFLADGKWYPFEEQYRATIKSYPEGLPNEPHICAAPIRAPDGSTTGQTIYCMTPPLGF